MFLEAIAILIKDSKFKTCLLPGFVISRDILGFRESRILFLWSGFAAGIRSLTASFKLYSVAERFKLKYYNISKTRMDNTNFVKYIHLDTKGSVTGTWICRDMLASALFGRIHFDSFYQRQKSRKKKSAFSISSWTKDKR